MIVAYYIFEFAATYFESFMCYYFGYIFSTNNSSKKKMFFLSALLTIMILYLNTIKLFSTYTLIFAVAYVFITESIFMNIKLIESVSISSFFVVILNAFDGITISLFSIITKNANIMYFVISEYSFYRILFVLISKVLFFICFYLMKNYMMKNFLNMKNVHKISTSAMGIIGMTFLLKFTFCAQDTTAFLGWGMFLGIIIISIYAIYWFISYREEMLNISRSKLEQYIIESRYEILQQDYKKNAQNFHDLKNHMLVIYKLLDNNYIHQAEDYIKQFINIDNSIINGWTGNELLDYILCIKKKKAEEFNIKFIIDADYINKFGISDNVICSIFTNLIDNAIEACNKIINKTRYINIVIRRINSFIIIKVTNSIECEPTIKNKILLSNKKGTNHGLGFDIIVSSVRSNNGVITYNFNKKQFQVNITFFDS